MNVACSDSALYIHVIVTDAASTTPTTVSFSSDCTLENARVGENPTDGLYTSNFKQFVGLRVEDVARLNESTLSPGEQSALITGPVDWPSIRHEQCYMM